MSDTPRTDAHPLADYGGGDVGPADVRELLEFARTLERELTAYNHASAVHDEPG